LFELALCSTTMAQRKLDSGHISAKEFTKEMERISDMHKVLYSINYTILTMDKNEAPHYFGRKPRHY
jgi:hypothetical protein